MKKKYYRNQTAVRRRKNFFHALFLFLPLLYLNSISSVCLASAMPTEPTSFAKKAPGTDPSSKLLEAVLANNIASAQQYLEDGANVNVTDEKGNTGLHITIKKYGNHKMVALLVAFGIDVTLKNDEKKQTALQVAVIANNPECVNILLGDTKQENLEKETRVVTWGYVREQDLRFLPDDIKNLIAKFGQSFIDMRDSNGDTALHLAVSGRKKPSKRF